MIFLERNGSERKTSDMPRVLQYLWWPTEALISQEGTISPGEGMVFPHSRGPIRGALMRDKHHLVLDSWTTESRNISYNKQSFNIAFIVVTRFPAVLMMKHCLSL